MRPGSAPKTVFFSLFVCEKENVCADSCSFAPSWALQNSIGGKPEGPVGNGTSLFVSHHDTCYSKSNMYFCFQM